MFRVGEVRVKREGFEIEEDKVFQILRTVSVPGSTLEPILLVFSLHCSKLRTPLLGGVNIFSVDLFEIGVVETSE